MFNSDFNMQPDPTWIRLFDGLHRRVTSSIATTICALTTVLPVVAPAHAADTAANKATVLAYYEAGFIQKDFEKAVQYLSPHYKQHRPSAADGPEGLRKVIEFLREKFPRAHGEIKRVVAEGDFVVLHIHFKRDPEGRGDAIVDIYRLADGRIAEHWDVQQEVPEKPANLNGMF